MKRIVGSVVRGKGAPEGVTRFVASEAVVDRMGDIVDQGGWSLAEFRANPVIPWGHDYQQLPVGRAVHVEVKDGQLLVDVQWDRNGALGAEVARMFDEGMLNAVSVGFVPGRAVWRNTLEPDHPYFGERGQVFYENKLLEVSAVVVPALGSALAQRSLGAPGEADASAVAALMRSLFPVEGDADPVVDPPSSDPGSAGISDLVVEALRSDPAVRAALREAVARDARDLVLSELEVARAAEAATPVISDAEVFSLLADLAEPEAPEVVLASILTEGSATR